MQAGCASFERALPRSCCLHIAGIARARSLHRQNQPISISTQKPHLATDNQALRVTGPIIRASCVQSLCDRPDVKPPALDWSVLSV